MSLSRETWVRLHLWRSTVKPQGPAGDPWPQAWISRPSSGKLLKHLGDQSHIPTPGEFFCRSWVDAFSYNVWFQQLSQQHLEDWGSLYGKLVHQCNFGPLEFLHIVCPTYLELLPSTNLQDLRGLVPQAPACLFSSSSSSASDDRCGLLAQVWAPWAVMSRCYITSATATGVQLPLRPGVSGLSAQNSMGATLAMNSTWRWVGPAIVREAKAHPFPHHSFRTAVTGSPATPGSIAPLPTLPRSASSMKTESQIRSMSTTWLCSLPSSSLSIILSPGVASGAVQVGCPRGGTLRTQVVIVTQDYLLNRQLCCSKHRCPELREGTQQWRKCALALRHSHPQ